MPTACSSAAPATHPEDNCPSGWKAEKPVLDPEIPSSCRGCHGSPTGCIGDSGANRKGGDSCRNQNIRIDLDKNLRSETRNPKRNGKTTNC